MTFPDTILDSFSRAEEEIRQSPWYGDCWSCCSGLWKTDRYGDTVLLKISKSNWSSVFPVSLYEGGEIQYAAWVDEDLFRRSTVRFEMHVFSFPSQAVRKIKKGDFTNPFREENQATINGFGFHDTKKGPAVPYAGARAFQGAGDLTGFLVKDFSGFASLSDSIDRHLQRVTGKQG